MQFEDDQHPVIIDLKKRIAGTMADSVTDDMIAGEFLYMDPATRAETLLKTEQWAATDDGTDLRKRAQLLTLSRNMRNIDLAMRKSGR
jgi:hypothetical protein